MTKDDLPLYDAHEQGVDQDYHPDRPHDPRRDERNARYKSVTRKSLAELLGKNGGIDGSFVPPSTSLENFNAVIYLRVSSEEQARKGGGDEGYSIPYQRDACTNKAASLGLVVVGEYVDAGQSAKSANRPKLKKMLAELTAKRVRYVIVHKIDRLARNKRDDFLINEAIAEAGASLISVVDLVDDTPQGKFNYTIQAGLAQLYVDNLAVEVMKGLSKKAEAGGTPYRSPVGYLNKRRIEGVADIRWVEPDPERAPLISWAFTEYATGNWALSNLRKTLTAKGMTTRPTAKRPAKALTVNGLHTILTNPYYTGLLPWQGAYYEGSHEPLVSVETWLRVQDVLHSHNQSGAKDRHHPHYLKGSIFCAGCGSRLTFSRNVGRGGAYDYFVCNGRRFKEPPCRRRAVRVEAAEMGVVEFYQHFEIPPERIAAIREAIHSELAANREQARQMASMAKKRLASVQHQRQKLLDAHYAGAVPVDLLKTEMDRLTAERADAERELANAEAGIADLENQLARALAAVGNCAASYATAPPAVRRLMNQGFFTKLYLDTDGSVERADMAAPFAQLHDKGTCRVTEAPPSSMDGASADKENHVTTVYSFRPGTVRSATRHSPDVTISLSASTRQSRMKQGRLTPSLGVEMTVLVEVPGIEPGSSAASSRLLRAQLTMPLLGPTDHMSKFGVTGPAAVSFPISVRGRHWR